MTGKKHEGRYHTDYHEEKAIKEEIINVELRKIGPDDTGEVMEVLDVMPSVLSVLKHPPMNIFGTIHDL